MARVNRHLRVAGGDDGNFAAAYEGVEQGEYDPRAFYVDSFNKHNHRAETRVAMKPEIYGRIQDMISSGALVGTPIKSYQAFMRDSAYHNLERVGRLLNDPDILEFAARARRLAMIERESEETEALRKLVEDADERLNQATKAGDTWFVGRLLEMYETEQATMREPFATELDDVLKDARRWLRAKQ